MADALRMVTLRLTNQERVLLRQRANAANMSMNRYVRWLVGLSDKHGSFDTPVEVKAESRSGKEES